MALDPEAANGRACAPPPHPLDAWRQPRRLLEALALQPGQHVAEIGAGGGYLTPWLAWAVGSGGRVVATEEDPLALAALQRRTAGLPQVVVQGSASARLDTGAYDLILLAQVDHLLPEGALAALWPALRPGGQLALCNTEPRLAGARRAALALDEIAVLREPALELPGQFLLLLRHRDLSGLAGIRPGGREPDSARTADLAQGGAASE